MDIIGDEEMALESELDPWLEQELQRQVEAEQATYYEPPAPPAPPRPKPLRAEVPTDLINDIESFKQQVRREQGIPPPESKRQPADIVGDPTKLRLTPAQQAQVPAYFMTVHVYDQDAAKRFVLINALRYVEGEETRDGILVERIIPEGAVLSYLGNPFFVRR
jgi:general secretion pathway protein B